MIYVICPTHKDFRNFRDRNSSIHAESEFKAIHKEQDMMGYRFNKNTDHVIFYNQKEFSQTTYDDIMGFIDERNWYNVPEFCNRCGL